MSKITDFLQKLRAPIIWTFWYVFTIWTLLYALFDFNLFSRAHWIHVLHAHLHGFGGFTFCMIILAAIPLYIATTIIVARTGKPLITIPMPKFITNITDKIFTKQNTEPEAEPKSETENESVPDIPTNEEQDKYPAEMRGVFIRARGRPTPIVAPICNVCSVTPNVYPNTADTANAAHTDFNSDLPLPPDFDTDDDFIPDTQPQPISSAPSFQEINFFDDDDDNNEQSEYIDSAVTEHLNKTNQEFNIVDDDLILTNDKVIATHNDDDFWIMDEPTWFAAGKTRQSPIDTLLSAAEQHKTKPILYLGATNIMKFDEKRTEWESKGITVITDLSNL